MSLKRLPFLMIGLAFFTGACGKNPLLEALSSDFYPVQVGDTWNYASADGVRTRQVTVSAAGAYYGQNAFKVDFADVNIGSAGASAYSVYLVRDPREVEYYDAASGRWILYLKLPFLVGNRWDLPQDVANSTGRVMYVDGKEAVQVPAGSFSNCVRLRDTSFTVDASGNTGESTSLAWMAPDVGEVATGSMDNAGNTTKDLELKSYRVLR